LMVAGAGGAGGGAAGAAERGKVGEDGLDGVLNGKREDACPCERPVSICRGSSGSTMGGAARGVVLPSVGCQGLQR
jgi:hypothetical protein